jgi:signal transduction protein with GAF and PtsI domain
MVPASVPLVKSIIRSIPMVQARELAEAALAAGTAVEVLERCRTLAAQVAPEILELV